MENSFYNMELAQFRELFAEGRLTGLGEDLCIIDVRNEDMAPRLQTPVRLDAYLAVFCISGRIHFSINMKEFTMEEDDLALMVPGYIGQVLDAGAAMENGLHYVIVGISRRYLSTLHLDLNRIFAEGRLLLDNPCVRLTSQEKEIAHRYLELGETILGSDLPSRRECVGMLISSLFSLSEGVFDSRLELARHNAARSMSRAEEVFNKFLQLLADHHTKERSAGFYADKLCLSPKYFSKLVKSASGRSAPEWIDTYVILEAKNYLKYSDMSVKQIVYQLNFPDQPTFTKYFKAHTGMTPAQFRKG